MFRLPTSKKRMSPSFLLLGGQKCGTTTLYDQISRNKQVLPATMKEIHYFDNNYNKSFNWYGAHYPLKTSEKITGEATAFYLFHPLVAERVKKTFPDIKLIIIVRNPVKRAFSQYQHNIRLKRENLTFDKAIKMEETRLKNEPILENKLLFSHWFHSYKKMGCYIEQIKNWLKYFKREQLFITSLELLNMESKNTINDIFTFLQLDNENFSILKEAENVGGYKEKMNKNTEIELSEYFESYNKELFNFVGKKLW